MGIKKKIFVGLATIAITMGLYGYREYIRKNKNLSYVKANFKIQANALIKEFEENEKKANEKFLDKIIAVSGAIRDVIKDDKGYYSIVLGGDENMSTVRCSMNSIDQDEVGLLKKGNIIMIKGACTGFNADDLLGSDIILNRCVIQKNDSR
jgi:hypothetical protein